MLEEHLAIPFAIAMLGVEATVERVDLTDDERIVAVCVRGKSRQRISILDLPCPDVQPAGWEWIEAHRRRARGRQVVALTPIDRDKLRDAILKMGNQYVFSTLDDVILFADEGGSWQVGVDWERVLPAWMKVLSATADPEEYVQRIMWVLEHHYHYGSKKMLILARRTATPEQRRALPKA
jgi:hypothetical protein